MHASGFGRVRIGLIVTASIPPEGDCRFTVREKTQTSVKARAIATCEVREYAGACGQVYAAAGQNSAFRGTPMG